MKSLFHRIIMSALSLGTLIATPSAFAAIAPSPRSALEKIVLPAVTLPSADGQQVALRAATGKHATVLVFVSTECPISNGYVATLIKLSSTYSPKGVAFVALNPNDGQSLRAMAVHQREYGLSLPVLKDAGGTVAKSVGVSHCPAVCVFDADSRLRYRGRIDDRYFRRGGAARAVQSEDLKNAVEAVLAGKSPSPATTEPIGCPIAGALALQSDTAKAGQEKILPHATITYSNQVARIVQQHCQSCHRPGGIGPFELTNYQHAVAWSADIATFVADGSMPPWKPVAGHGEFHNRRTMPTDEIRMIQDWVKAGCPEGDRKDLPPPKTFSDTWTFGTPDLVLQPSEAYQLSSDGRDEYRCFVLPTNLNHDVYVTAIEVLPGNKKVVHHVIGFIDTTGASERLDAADPGPGYQTSAGPPGFLPSGGLGGWAPGNAPHPLPAGMAKVLPKGAKVVMQVHYHKSGKPEVDRTRLGLYFAKGEVNRAVRALPVMPLKGRFGGLRITPNDPNYEMRASLYLPRDLLALSITPHMHLIGKDMKVTAVLPDGTTQPLVYVKNWDFNWQETYQYKEPLLLPKGTRIDLMAHWDNSAANPNNPSRPPKLVRWGEQTTDEMCIAFIEVAPAQAAKSPADLRGPDRRELLREMLLEQFRGRLRKE